MISKPIRTTLIALMGLAIGGAALAASAKKPEATKAPAASMDTTTIATIGDVKITEQDLMSSMPPERQGQFTQANQRIQDTERGAMTETFAQRYVEEQAKAKGITPDEFWSQEIASNKDSMSSEFKVQIAQIKQQIYDAKRMALDDLIGKKLEEKAAKDKGTTVEELQKTEVEAKIMPVTPADIDQYFAQNQRQFGGQTKEAVSKQIEDQIRNQRITMKRNEWRNSLRASSNVRVNLEVPRITVSLDDDPTRGSKSAPVQIVLFSDFQCPFCSRVEATIKQVRDTYGDKVAVTFRDYPLSFHQNAEKAAEAANCANKQGKYWEFHDALFANQAQIAVPDLKKKAEELKLDVAAFNQCLDSGEMKAEIEKDTKEGSTYGVTGTPASFVNGRFLSGAQPYESFKKVIDDELQMKGIAVPTAQATPVTETTTVKR